MYRPIQRCFVRSLAAWRWRNGSDLGVGQYFQDISDRYSPINLLVKPERHVRQWRLDLKLRAICSRKAGIKHRDNATTARDVGCPNAESSPTSVLYTYCIH